MLMTIVYRTRDCVGIAGVQHIDGPLQVKHWGVRTRFLALTPMPYQLGGLLDVTFIDFIV